MSDRRKDEREDGSDRRSFPRPPFKLNLILLLLGLVLAGVAFSQRNRLDQQFQAIVSRGASSPDEIRKIRNDLSQMDLTEQEMKRELAARLEQAKVLQSNDFYLSLDTRRKQFALYYGNDVVREAPMEIGPPATIKSPGATYTFAPLKGTVTVKKKYEDLGWRVPEWVYVMQQQPVPADRPVVEGGLGKYVIELPNNYTIHSPPSPDSPLKGPKPGSFMVPEEEMKAIWARVHEGTRVFIF
jgi:hypothetical protein